MRNVSRHIIRIETAFAGTCLSTSTVLIFIAAVARSFDHPINWALDISLFLFAWATFVSADVAYRDDKLVNLDIFSHRLADRTAALLKIGVYFVILLFLAALVIYGGRLVYVSRARAFQGIPTVSFSWVTLSIPVGAALMIQTTMEKIRALVRGESVTMDAREALNVSEDESSGTTGRV